MVDKNRVKKILLITLSNIGDVILTSPVITALKEEFPEARLSVVVGPRARGLFLGDPQIEEVFAYDKAATFGEKLKFMWLLRSRRYDLVADLRNSLIPIFLSSRYRTGMLSRSPKNIRHMRDRHLWRLKPLLSSRADLLTGSPQPYLWIEPEVGGYMDGVLSDHGIGLKDKMVAVSPGARSHTKRWKKEGFREVCNRLIEEEGIKVVMVGDKEDQPLVAEIVSDMSNQVVDLCGQTNLKQLAHLLKRCALLISNDSAPMHISWAVGTPVVAIFGPTDSSKYRPLGRRNRVIRKELSCSPCELALCKFNHECMDQIQADEVFEAAREISHP